MKLKYVYAFMVFVYGQHMAAHEQNMRVQFDDLFPKTQFQKTLELCMCVLAMHKQHQCVPSARVHNVISEFQKIDATKVLPDDLAYLASLIAVINCKDL